MNLFMENKIALITGGAGGIGSAIAKRLAESGHDVVINYCHSKDSAEISKRKSRNVFT